jgi:hypothetical protein
MGFIGKRNDVINFAGALHTQATCDVNGSYAFVYFPINDLTVKLELTKLRAKRFRAWWYGPPNGSGNAHWNH